MCIVTTCTVSGAICNDSKHTIFITEVEDNTIGENEKTTLYPKIIELSSHFHKRCYLLVSSVMKIVYMYHKVEDKCV